MDRGTWRAIEHRVTKSQDTTERLTLSPSDGRNAQGKAGGEGHRPSVSAPGASASQHHDVVTSLKAPRILLYGGFVQVSLHRHRFFCLFVCLFLGIDLCPQVGETQNTGAFITV